MSFYLVLYQNDYKNSKKEIAKKNLIYTVKELWNEI